MISKLVPHTPCLERDRDLVMSSNYIEQLNEKKKPGKLNSRVLTASLFGLHGNATRTSFFSPYTIRASQQRT